MKKRFLYPIWKFDELEKELSALEENGWRLNKIHSIRNFEFLKSTPKSVKYFFTYSMPREKKNMYSIESTLTQKFNANKIQGNLTENWGIIHFYRITKQVDVEELLVERNTVLRHYLIKNIVYITLLLMILLLPLIFGMVLNPEKFLNDVSSNPIGTLFIICCLVLIIFGLVYNIVGYGYLNKKLLKSEKLK